VALSDDTLGRFVGTYTNKTGLEYSVTQEDGHLLFKTQSQPPIEVYAQSGTNFSTKILNAEIAFGVTKECRSKGEGSEAPAGGENDFGRKETLTCCSHRITSACILTHFRMIRSARHS